MSTSVSRPDDPGYTRAMAAAEPAASIRRAAGPVDRSRLLDGTLRTLSVPYGVLCVTAMIVGLLPLMPFFFWSIEVRLRRGPVVRRTLRPRAATRSTSLRTGRLAR